MASTTCRFARAEPAGPAGEAQANPHAITLLAPESLHIDPLRVPDPAFCIETD
ncbi:MAG: hypothetical protein KatS3mg077_1835 [Candidatus Binatia bacterium]|nr:MAG: hypothetical protein KatS3mg077_1835 [Candidatus Binatia bacterium]